MYPTLTDYIISGPHTLVCYVNDITLGIFMYFFLLAIFLIMTFSIMEHQKRKTGYDDFSVGFAVAAFTTCVATILLRIVDCGASPLVNDLALGVTIGFALIGIILVLKDR